MIVMTDRVVITGLGALTPLGNSWTETWDGLTNGRSGVARITQFDATDLPTQIAGEVKGFDPATRMSIKQVKRASRASQMAIDGPKPASATPRSRTPPSTSTPAAPVVSLPASCRSR
jgi:3-oxoacyl-[acyl-carrier-protein] synthase II